MKKIKAFLLVLLFTFSNSVNIFASIESYDNNEIPQTLKAILEDDMGNEIEVVGNLEEIVSRGNTRDVGYTFNLYRNSSNTLTTVQTDGSISVRVTLKLKYDIIDYKNNDYILLNEVYGNWQILDSKITNINGEISYGCVGFSLYSNSLIRQKNEQKLNYNYFFIDTNFNEPVKKVGEELSAQVGALMNLNISMGTRKWTFKVQSNV